VKIVDLCNQQQIIYQYCVPINEAKNKMEECKTLLETKSQKYGQYMISQDLEDRIIFDFYCLGCCVFEIIRWERANDGNPEFKDFADYLKKNEYFPELSMWANYSQKLREFM